MFAALVTRRASTIDRFRSSSALAAAEGEGWCTDGSGELMSSKRAPLLRTQRDKGPHSSRKMRRRRRIVLGDRFRRGESMVEEPDAIV